MQGNGFDCCKEAGLPFISCRRCRSFRKFWKEGVHEYRLSRDLQMADWRCLSQAVCRARSILIYQWIRCLGDYWWDETFTVVNGVLFVSAIAIILIPSKLYSSFVQLLLLLVVNAAYSG